MATVKSPWPNSLQAIDSELHAAGSSKPALSVSSMPELTLNMGSGFGRLAGQRHVGSDVPLVTHYLRLFPVKSVKSVVKDTSVFEPQMTQIARRNYVTISEDRRPGSLLISQLNCGSSGRFGQ